MRAHGESDRRNCRVTGFWSRPGSPGSTQGTKLWRSEASRRAGTVPVDRDPCISRLPSLWGFLDFQDFLFQGHSQHICRREETQHLVFPVFRVPYKVGMYRIPSRIHVPLSLERPISLLPLFKSAITKVPDPDPHRVPVWGSSQTHASQSPAWLSSLA